MIKAYSEHSIELLLWYYLDNNDLSFYKKLNIRTFPNVHCWWPLFHDKQFWTLNYDKENNILSMKSN